MIHIKNVQTLNKNGELHPVEVLIKDQKIQALGQNVTPDEANVEVIDGKNGLMTPGLIDVHVHFREPGFTDKETVLTGSQAAARGGFTTVFAMPNLNPVPDNPETFAELYALNKKNGRIKVEQYASISQNLTSETTLVDFKGLSEAGAIAFTNDGVGVQTAGLMYQAMQEAARVNKPLVAHTEDNSLLFGGVMHAGKRSEELGLPGMLGLTESTQIARDVLLAEKAGAHYHVCHVSTKESIRVIRDAKRAGINVTCEVAPHHLILTDADIPGDDTNYKMNPPLRAEDDRQALIEGLLDGTIDCIATDHAPHTTEEKAKGFKEAPFGITGLETAFQLMYTHFVKTDIFTLKQVVDWLTIKPAELFALDTGTLEVGQPADIAIFDLGHEEVIREEDFASKSSNTPFIGESVFGTTLFTICDGEVVYQK